MQLGTVWENVKYATTEGAVPAETELSPLCFFPCRLMPFVDDIESYN